jgi:glycosyltransferase involved in cell wall biosynthesis
MKPKVVMLFSMSFQPYQGRYLRVYNEARTLVDSGYDVTLLAWDREGGSPEEELRDGIQIKRFHIPAGVGMGPRRNALNVGKFNRAAFRYIMKHPFDIVHCHNLDAIVMSLVAARLRRKKAVLDLCEPEYYAFWDNKFSWLLPGINELEIQLAKRFDHLFVHNLYQVQRFRSRGISSLTQVGSYPNRSMIPNKIRNSGTEEVVIGRIGTIYENTGMEELIEAFSKLLEKQKKVGKRSSCRLFLAGRVYDSFRPTFEALVSPLKEYVEVYGPFQATDLSWLYEKIDISVMIYRKTRWFRNITPTKLFDSLANGVPVVANAIGDIPMILKEGRCGLIVDESDLDSICNGIEKLTNNSSLRLEMAENAMRLARDKYTWEACEDSFLSQYRSLMNLA